MTIEAKIDALQSRLDELKVQHAEPDDGPFFTDPCGILRHRSTGLTVSQEELGNDDGGYDARLKARVRRDDAARAEAGRKRAEGMADGCWRDPCGIVRGPDGRPAARIEAEQLARADIERLIGERHHAHLAHWGVASSEPGLVTDHDDHLEQE